jgi:hypothetical protein
VKQASESCPAVLRCIRCGKNLPRDCFYDAPRRKYGKASTCKPCRTIEQAGRRKNGYRTLENQRAKERRATDAGFAAKCRLSSIKYTLKKTGLSLEDYDTTLKQQGGCCAICGSAHDESVLYGRLYVDHDHGTGRFRGLLCKFCNAGLGHFKDDPQILEKALEYLKCRKSK